MIQNHNDINATLLSSESVDIPDVMASLSNITKVEDLPDGSSVYEVGEEESFEDDVNEKQDFYENLAEKISETELNGIASQLTEDIKNDKESRRIWEENYVKGLSYLGLKPEDAKKVPFMQACSAFDSTLSEALLRFFSIARAELFPASGPVKIKIKGQETDERMTVGERVKEWMNYYLTLTDHDYYPDSERLLMYLGLVGSAFRKVYPDPITNKPIARFIDPQDFIINNNCVSILSSDRLTHALYLSKKEIMLRQMSGFYRDVPLPNVNDDDLEDSDTSKKIRNIEGIDLHASENKSLFTFYEVHTDLDLADDDEFSQEDLPIPYIVTICATTRKVLSIRRNWDEGDTFYKRKEYFVQYSYLPGFGIYGMGLMNLIGSNAMALTSILRQTIDVATLKNFPGGLKVKGLRIENNDKSIGPSEFWDVETGGLPIRDSIMLMPYGEPSSALLQLRSELIQQTQSLAAMADAKISEFQPNAPATTTLALLEENGRLQSTILRSLRHSLGNELILLFNLFKESFSDSSHQFMIPGKEYTISREDFNDYLHITPVADPDLATSTQKMMKAEGILRIANGAPQLHDMRNVYRGIYEALGVKDIEKILPAEKQAVPLDPITENMNALEGKPLIAAIWQDHPSHNVVHQLMMDDPQTPPDVRTTLQAHVREHMAMQFAITMQTNMQQQMPPIEALMNPEVQNEIALMASNAVQQQMQQKQQQAGPSPEQIMVMDIEQRREAAQLKDKESKERIETEAFKAQLRFESEMEKIKAQKEMAEDKNETDLTIVELKQG